MTKATPIPSKQSSPPAGYVDIRGGIVELLNAARHAAARNVNSLMTASYWEIGRRIVDAEQKGKRRAGYGEQLIERLSLDLSKQFGRGFSSQNLWQMRQFFITWRIDNPADSGKRVSKTAATVPARTVASVSLAVVRVCATIVRER